MNEGEVCIPNIGVKNQQMRRNFGLVMLVISAVIGIVMLLMGAAFWLRLLLFVPFYLGMVGIFQAREKT